MISLQRVTARHDSEWEALIDRAPGATMFHRLSFLAYHPETRFKEHRFMARRHRAVVATIAFAEVLRNGRMEWRTPYGGSFGGWAAQPDVTAEEHLELARGVLDEARDAGAHAITVATMPAPYLAAGDLAEFALVASGAAAAGEEITHIVDLRGTPDDLRERIAGASKRGARKAERLGTTVRPGGVSDFPAFHAIVTAAAAHKGAKPTHSLDELQDLAKRFPKDLVLHVAENEGRIVGGILVFRCNPRAALSFYAARAEIPEANRAMDLLMERAIMDAKGAELEFLDFGTTTIAGSLNPGLATFKEEWGGVPWVRRTWRLDASLP